MQGITTMGIEGKEIIIDGVNVAECEHLIPKKDIKWCECSAYCSPYPECVSYDLCKGKNCYFKQLQRLKAGNEKWLKQYDLLQEDRVKLWTDNTKYKQALEEIREMINICMEFKTCEKCKFYKECDSSFEDYILIKIEEVLTDE